MQQNIQTTEAQMQTTIPVLEERGLSRRRRRRERGAKRRAAVATLTESSSYDGRHRAEGDAR